MLQDAPLQLLHVPLGLAQALLPTSQLAGQILAVLGHAYALRGARRALEVQAELQLLALALQALRLLHALAERAVPCLHLLLHRLPLRAELEEGLGLGAPAIGAAWHEVLGLVGHDPRSAICMAVAEALQQALHQFPRGGALRLHGHEQPQVAQALVPLVQARRAPLLTSCRIPPWRHAAEGAEATQKACAWAGLAWGFAQSAASLRSAVQKTPVQRLDRCIEAAKAGIGVVQIRGAGGSSGGGSGRCRPCCCR
mmetsp:Transcript_16555/g.49974  ORF Transcript_16555/g.49974 Transcript_16555/m.49974 type:complete len:254 (-) Transcript_16555:200-961(-)